jgi:streptogramin lyase
MTTEGLFITFWIPDRLAIPTRITTGPDGNLWFIEWNAGRVGRITPDGTLTEFPTPMDGLGPTGPQDIVSGPDDNLWFTRDRRISRMTTAGVVTDLPGSSTTREPSFLAVGPDGNLWATEPGCALIARMTLEGVVTEFPVAMTRYGPGEITSGTDGNLWFCNSQNIGRITPDGVVTELPLTLASSVAGVTSGPDGSVWFSDAQHTRLGRITP